jgi:hypothetical protein
MKKRKHALTEECLSVNLTRQLAAALKEAAARKAMTMSPYARYAIYDHVPPIRSISYYSTFPISQACGA